ncbi:hypothetical protein GUJ93_ZPchr0001g29632 [Zizania palustris]|uniref:Uncharacterized protein n=1 Tax=Zizania palustris TaxID=103762 RepID=A0A8J5S0D7_ZIZPA|nr:hypothetical protein GUJ93_ZPchr0001g29632 [Zizania palustris]
MGSSFFHLPCITNTSMKFHTVLPSCKYGGATMSAPTQQAQWRSTATQPQPRPRRRDGLGDGRSTSSRHGGAVRPRRRDGLGDDRSGGHGEGERCGRGGRARSQTLPPMHGLSSRREDTGRRRRPQARKKAQR